VQLVWVIDLTTWLVLVPMLMAVPDEEKRKYWKSVMFCFTSYNVSLLPLPLRGLLESWHMLWCARVQTTEFMCRYTLRFISVLAAMLPGCPDCDQSRHTPMQKRGLRQQN
jgi:hypothetical protein